MASSDRPLRILHLTAGSDAGGVSRYLHNLCGAMHAMGHDVAIAGERGAWHDLFEGAPYPWIEAPLKSNLLPMWRAPRQLRRQLRDHPVDIIHAHFRRSLLAGRRAVGDQATPILFTLHLTGIPIRGLWGLLSDFGDHVHCPSAEAKRWLTDEAEAPTPPISVIPHGIDCDRFPRADQADQQAARQALGLPQDALIAAFVGRFDRPKNEKWIIDLAARAKASSGDAGSPLGSLHLVMAGGGPDEREVRQRIAQQGLGDRVTVLGYGPPLPVYQAADAVLLPSSLEGFSLVTTEAMSVGRPVLRTRTAGTEEHIIEGVTGASVPIDHEAFLRGAIEFLADRPALARMGQAAAEHVRKHLTLDRQVEQTIDLYRRLVATGAARGASVIADIPLADDGKPMASLPGRDPVRPIFHQLNRTVAFPYTADVYIRRILWKAVERTAIAWSLPRQRQWRRFWLTRFGARIGQGSSIRPSTKVTHPWLLTMGQHSIISDGVNVYNLGPITIGDHTVISHDAYLCAGTHDYTQPTLPLQRPAITIGSGVWVCAGAFIGPGVTIGDNSVVGARAVVFKDVPPNTVVAGNPARVVKNRPMQGYPPQDPPTPAAQ